MSPPFYITIGRQSVPSAMAVCCDLSFVESQTVQPEDLTVIGHIGDHSDTCARNLTHIHILPRCSTLAETLLKWYERCEIYVGKSCNA